MNPSLNLPLQLNERTILIDVLRGFALLGVIIANLAGFITFALPDEQVALLTNTKADKIAGHFLMLFIDNKFITIFSLLFGYGFGVVMERVAAKGINVNSFFIRRMLILFLFSLLHLGIWWGEILNVYSTCGLLLLFFRKSSNRKLLIWAAVLLLICTPLIQGLKIYLLPANTVELDNLLTEYVISMKGKSIPDILYANYKAVWYIFFERWSQYRDMCEVLAKFLIGYYVLRMGWLSNIGSYLPGIKKMQKITLLISLFYLLEKIVIEIYGFKLSGNEMKLAEYVFTRVGILSLSIFYCTTLVLIYHNNKDLKLFQSFRWVGMMSLTNYLTQTLFYVVLFYGLGFGMLGNIHLQWVIPIGVAFYFLQSILSCYWLRYFNYGPAEWIWRQLTYGKKFPLKKHYQSHQIP